MYSSPDSLFLSLMESIFHWSARALWSAPGARPSQKAHAQANGKTPFYRGAITSFANKKTEVCTLAIPPQEAGAGPPGPGDRVFTRMLTPLIDGLGHTQRGPQFLDLERLRFSKIAIFIFDRLLRWSCWYRSDAASLPAVRE